MVGWKGEEREGQRSKKNDKKSISLADLELRMGARNTRGMNRAFFSQ